MEAISDNEYLIPRIKKPITLNIRLSYSEAKAILKQLVNKIERIERR